MTEKNIDYDYAAKVELEIAKKYGRDVIEHPKNEWNVSKEKEYIRQAKNMAIKESGPPITRRPLEEDVLIDERLINSRKRTLVFTRCPVCDKICKEPKDDVYLKLFECCYICAIKKGFIR